MYKHITHTIGIRHIVCYLSCFRDPAAGAGGDDFFIVMGDDGNIASTQMAATSGQRWLPNIDEYNQPDGSTVNTFISERERERRPTYTNTVQKYS